MISEESEVSQKPFEKVRKDLKFLSDALYDQHDYSGSDMADDILSEFDKAYSESRKQIEERRSKLEVGPIDPVKITRQQELNWILENILPEISEKIEK